MPAKEKITDEELKRLISAGKNDYEIGRLAGIHHDSVRRRRVKLGLTSPGRHYVKGLPGKRARKLSPKDLGNKCAGCAYSCKLYFGTCCDYLLTVGHSRGCPPGDACTVYKPLKRTGGTNAADRD